MRVVAVLGAGHGGLATAADLGRRGFDVRLHNRSAEPLEPVRAHGGIVSRGEIGEGFAPVQATADLGEAVEAADAVVLVLPGTAHAAIATALVEVIPEGVPVILNPGHMCGSLHVRRVFERAGRDAPPVAELGTLAYICRSPEPGVVHVFLRARGVPVAATPEDEGLLRLAGELFPGVRPVASPAEAWLHDVNLVLHPPGMVLSAAWIERGGDFLFYAEGVTPSVERTLSALDAERLGVGAALGVPVRGLAETMAALGSADAEAAGRGDLGAAVRGGRANATIAAPSQVDHRYLNEDVAFGVVPLMALADVLDVPTPVASAVTTLAETITGHPYRREGLNAAALGIENLDAEGLRRLARTA